ncbi:MAG TPA: Uma2 family endonuclease [Gemmatimonadales bacterium]|jgi:hypothetical protein
MAPIKRFTADDVRALPDDGKRYETVHGELLVSPTPRDRHQVVVGRLYLALGNYLVDHGIEWLLMSPSDISFDLPRGGKRGHGSEFRRPGGEPTPSNKTRTSLAHPVRVKTI